MLAASPPSAVAQRPDQRAEIALVRDSLAAIDNGAQLLALERSWIDLARENRDDPVIHLRLGFLALRLGDVRQRREHYDDAAAEFEWAVELSPGWPYAWYGLGLAERRLARTTGNPVYGVRAWLGTDQRSIAADAFAQAAREDPAFLPALEQLTEITGELHVNQRPAIALAAFRLAGDTELSQEPRFHLLRGRLERSFGSADSAVTAFERYRDLGGDQGLALLELARSKFLTGAPDASDDYYAGAQIDDSVTVAGYRADIEPIATTEELAEFDAASGSDRAEVLREFWQGRDDASLQLRGHRLFEHFTRLAHARASYPRPPFDRRYGFGEYFENSTEFDDRGVIYIRHGQPTATKQIVNPTADAYGAEIWRYDLGQLQMAFYFLATEDPQDYRMRATPLELPIRGGEDLLDIDGRLVTARVASARFANEVRIKGKEDIETGTSTDSHELRVDSLAGWVQVAGTGAASGATMAHVAWSARWAELAAPDSTEVTVELRLVLSDAAGRTRARIDRAVEVSAADTTDRGLVQGVVSLPLDQPGRYRYRVALISGNGGVVPPADTVDVPAFSTELAMSQPLLGLREPGLGWAAEQGRDSVFFNPRGLFPDEGDLEIYYELYGLTRGTDYRLTMHLEKIKGGGFLGLGGGGKEVSFDFSQTASGPVMTSARTLRLADLGSGRYRLTVTMTDPAGTSVSRQREFEVQD